MLVEILDPEIILGVVAAFFVGLFVLYTIYKIKSSIKRQERFDASSYDRLEFYERQLIDMKIRLDSLEIDSEGVNLNEIKDFGRVVEKIPNYEEYSEPKPKRHTPKPRQAPIMDYNNTIDFVLGLITNKSMTSRDIQNASQRSREHTSRLMKKLYQEGYVERDVRTKPFTYSITDKGKAKLGVLEYLQNTAA
ncbi:MAG: winged helix DNA-binding protein [Nitrosopumilaceae archaeon]